MSAYPLHICDLIKYKFFSNIENCIINLILPCVIGQAPSVVLPKYNTASSHLYKDELAKLRVYR